MLARRNIVAGLFMFPAIIKANSLMPISSKHLYPRTNQEIIDGIKNIYADSLIDRDTYAKTQYKIDQFLVALTRIEMLNNYHIEYMDYPDGSKVLTVFILPIENKTTNIPFMIKFTES